MMQNWDKYLNNSGLVVVVSGPSGVGKDTVLEELESIHKTARCVTTTTRKPRTSEIDGVDYNFITKDEFEEKIQLDWFLEYADVFGNYYGTPKDTVLWCTKKGEDVILKIDVQGGISIKSKFPNTVLIFLVPPSLDELERRLRERQTDSEEDIIRRLSDAKHELGYIKEYDYIVENDYAVDAAEKIKSIIVANRCRIQK